jgi:hypothetical protein
MYSAYLAKIGINVVIIFYETIEKGEPLSG